MRVAIYTGFIYPAQCGFLNAAHPYENPNGLTNVFGGMVGKERRAGMMKAQPFFG